MGKNNKTTHMRAEGGPVNGPAPTVSLEDISPLLRDAVDEMEELNIRHEVEDYTTRRWDVKQHCKEVTRLVDAKREIEKDIEDKEPALWVSWISFALLVMITGLLINTEYVVGLYALGGASLITLGVAMTVTVQVRAMRAKLSGLTESAWHELPRVADAGMKLRTYGDYLAKRLNKNPEETFDD